MKRAPAELRWSFPALLAALLLFPPTTVLAQLVDRGEFALSINGEPAGTEEFVIQRQGSGAAQTTLAQGTVTLLSGETITSQLQLTGTALSVFRYSVRVTGDDERTVNVARTGDRLQARTVAPWGEELREYRAATETLLLDRSVAHHYFLLGPLLDAPPESVHSVAPLSEAEEGLSGLAVESGVVQVGGDEIEGRRITLRAAAGEREVWFDGSGRLIKVTDSATGFTAERLPAA
ncbi:MAG: hypothetical protein ACR2QM_10795 [Longimicrobiales bacterium]